MLRATTMFSRKLAEQSAKILIEKIAQPSSVPPKITQPTKLNFFREINLLKLPKQTISQDSRIIAQQMDSNVVPDESASFARTK